MKELPQNLDEGSFLVKVDQPYTGKQVIAKAKEAMSSLKQFVAYLHTKNSPLLKKIKGVKIPDSGLSSGEAREGYVQLDSGETLDQVFLKLLAEANKFRDGEKQRKKGISPPSEAVSSEDEDVDVDEGSGNGVLPVSFLLLKYFCFDERFSLPAVTTVVIPSTVPKGSVSSSFQPATLSRRELQRRSRPGDDVDDVSENIRDRLEHLRAPHPPEISMVQEQLIIEKTAETKKRTAVLDMSILRSRIALHEEVLEKLRARKDTVQAEIMNTSLQKLHQKLIELSAMDD